MTWGWLHPPWAPGPLLQGSVSSWLFPQSLDAQPEQLALRPKEFFRAYGIEVFTEAQVEDKAGEP